MVSNSLPFCPKKRILLVDDHPIMRKGLRKFLAVENDLEVCGDACDADTALEAAGRLHPDMAIIDISMPGQNGIELTKSLRAQLPHLTILVVSMHDEALYAERVLRAGAQGYIMKDQGGEKILKAIRQILRGDIFVSEQMSSRMLQNCAPGHRENGKLPMEQLTDREFEVFLLIGQGQGTRQIAEQLGVSVNTIDAHRAHIKEKLNLSGGNELVRLAIRWVETNAVE